LSGIFACEIWRRRHREKRFRRVGVRCVELLALLGLALLVYGSFVEPHILTTTKFSVPFGASESLRIVVIGDLHVGPYTGNGKVERAVERANQLLPDFVFLTGDFILGNNSDLSLLDPLGDLRTTQGVYAVLGNHDAGFVTNMLQQRMRKDDQSEAVATKLAALGATVLRNTHAVVHTGDTAIAIAGVEDIWANRHNLAAALSGIPEKAPVILLSHNPDSILHPQIDAVDLVVSGHTHGGQMRLPLLGSLARMPTELGRDFDHGLFPFPASAKDEGSLFITRGVGVSGPRARLFAWPEVALLTTTAAR